ncbi:MAG: pentapeptide repeat-containing protein [Candidatus Hodarchaeota archaeon]
MEDLLILIYKLLAFIMSENFKNNHILIMNFPMVVTSVIFFIVGFHKAYLSDDTKHFPRNITPPNTGAPDRGKNPSMRDIAFFVPILLILVILGLMNTYFAIFTSMLYLPAGIDLLEKSKGRISIWDKDTITIPFRKVRRLSKACLVIYATISGAFRLPSILDYYTSRVSPFIGGRTLAIVQLLMPYLGALLAVFFIILASRYYSRWGKPAWELPLDQIKMRYGVGVLKRFYNKHLLPVLLILSGFTIVLILGYTTRQYLFHSTIDFINSYLYAFEGLIVLNTIVMVFSIITFFLHRSTPGNQPFLPFVGFIDGMITDMREGKARSGGKQTLKLENVLVPIIIALGFAFSIVALFIMMFRIVMVVASYSRSAGSRKDRLACVTMLFFHVLLLIGISYVYYLALGGIVFLVLLVAVLAFVIHLAGRVNASNLAKSRTISRTVPARSRATGKKVAVIVLVSYLSIFATTVIHGIAVQPNSSEIRISIVEITLSDMSLEDLNLENVSVDVRVGEVIFEDIVIMDAAIYQLNGSKLDFQVVDLEDIYISGISASEYWLNNFSMGGLNLNALPFPGISFENATLEGANCAYGDVQSISCEYIILHDVFLDSISVDFTRLKHVRLEDIHLDGVGIDNFNINGVDLQKVLLNQVDVTNQDTMEVTIRDVSLSDLSLGTLGLDGLQLDGTSLAELSLDDVLLEYVAFNQIKASDLIAINPELGGLYLENLSADRVFIKNESAEVVLADVLMDSASFGSITAPYFAVEDVAFNFLDSPNASVQKVIIRDIEDASIGVINCEASDLLLDNLSITVTLKIEG